METRLFFFVSLPHAFLPWLTMTDLLQVSISRVKQSVHIQVSKGRATVGADVGSTVLDLLRTVSGQERDCRFDFIYTHPHSCTSPFHDSIPLIPIPSVPLPPTHSNSLPPTHTFFSSASMAFLILSSLYLTTLTNCL